MKKVLYLLIILMNFTSFATEYFVSNAIEIAEIMNNAQPGDTLTMINGIWTDEQIEFHGNGNKEDSIVLRAEVPGEVILNGNSHLSIGGTYLKVDGLCFLGGYNVNGIIKFESGSQHCRVTNTEIAEFNPPNESTRYHWIIMKGSHHRLDHCLFRGKNHSGVIVLVSLSSAPYGFHRIDHNHFANVSEGNGNGYEVLKVSSGPYSNLNGNIIAEYNYFYRCDGEIEIISNKCNNNIYRYNTFVECKGTLTLRQGMNCIVEGNYFFGNDRTDTGGIRIMGRGHRIFNNYFQDLGGTSNRSAIVLYSGMDYTDYVPGEGGHVRADSNLIVHNTIVNCAEGIYSGYLDPDDTIRLGPKDNIYANNIITMDDNATCFVMDKMFPEINQFWEANILYGTNLGDVPKSGYIVIDPKLVFLNGWYQITETSPALDAGSGEYPFVIEDIDGVVRDEYKDIGADELGHGKRYPLTENDVGPDWIETTIIQNDKHILSNYYLYQNYPNPFNLETKISFVLQKAGLTKIYIYNIIGDKIAEIQLGNLSKGFHQIKFNSSNLASGVYFYTIKSGNFSCTKKMILVR